MRKYFGNEPEGPGWDLYAAIGIWNLWARPQWENDWVNFKLVAVEPVTGMKANYWWSENMRTRALGKPRDLAILRDKDRDLHDRVRDACDDVLNELLLCL